MEVYNIFINIAENYDVFVDIIVPIICALIGGGLTLLGVRTTIRNENEMKKEDNSIVYKPILSFTKISFNPPDSCLCRDVGLAIPIISTNDDLKKENKNKKYYDYMSDTTVFPIILQNKGRAETYNAILDDFKIRNVGWDDATNLYVKNCGNQYIGQILKDDSFIINIELPNYIFMPDRKDVDYKLETSLYISYADMFNRKKYQYILNMDFNVEIHCYEDCEPYNYKNLKYSRVIYHLENIMPENKVYSNKRKKYVYDYELPNDNK